jgi:hypothetical protein
VTTTLPAPPPPVPTTTPPHKPCHGLGIWCPGHR